MLHNNIFEPYERARLLPSCISFKYLKLCINFSLLSTLVFCTMFCNKHLYWLSYWPSAFHYALHICISLLICLRFYAFCIRFCIILLHEYSTTKLRIKYVRLALACALHTRVGYSYKYLITHIWQKKYLTWGCLYVNLQNGLWKVMGI